MLHRSSRGFGRREGSIGSGFEDEIGLGSVRRGMAGFWLGLGRAFAVFHQLECGEGGSYRWSYHVRISREGFGH